MRSILVLAAALVLTACGVETATTAATAAAVKKQEIEQGKKTMEQMQQNIGQALEQQRTREADGAAEK